MTSTPLYLTDLPSSERLTLWTIRRLAGRETGTRACSGTAGGLFMPCFRQEFLAVAQAFHSALTDMAALEIPMLDIRSGSALAVTETEYTLLLATEAAQNECETDMHALLRSLLPSGGLQTRMAAALTTLGACLAGAGYWLSRRTARALSPFTGGSQSGPSVSYPATAALSLARWHDLNMRPTPSPMARMPAARRHWGYVSARPSNMLGRA